MPLIPPRRKVNTGNGSIDALMKFLGMTGKGETGELSLSNEEIQQVLAQHGEKNFVQRILKPESFPFMTLPSGDVASHRMAWGEVDGKFAVFPTIVQEADTLREMEPQTAFQHAIKTGEFIPFSDAKTADAFSQQYKKVWQDKKMPWETQ
tara:strand:+ start:28 stop:477 length:450 start_codon:yes stop_codon:yes gene_type:complete